MKKIMMLLIAANLINAAEAQYKKASFFTKDGRVYEMGVVNSFFSNREGKAPLSIFYSNSIEAGKSLSVFSDFEYMLKSKFSYTATYNDPTTYNSVTGKVIANRGSALVIKYGVQYRFVQADAENEKFAPYLRLALAVAYDFGASNPVNEKGESISPTPEINSTAAFLGAEAGAGFSYYFTKNLGIRVGAAYRPGVTLASGFASGNIYNSFISHPMVSVSLKYKIFSE